MEEENQRLSVRLAATKKEGTPFLSRDDIVIKFNTYDLNGSATIGLQIHLLVEAGGKTENGMLQSFESNVDLSLSSLH